MSRARRWLSRFAISLLGLVLVALATLWIGLRQSLPQLDGERALAGLGAAASVERDALGVVTITAATRDDAYRALGFVHAQERFFEIDLMRRVAAGELAALMGRATVAVDRKTRVHRFRARARDVVAQASPEERAALEAYVAGANAGLAALGGRPFAYHLLRQEPKPLAPEDPVLVVYSMYLDLQGYGANTRELALGRMRAALPPSLYAFLTAQGTEWDAPLLGRPFGDPEIPPAGDVDLRKLDPTLFGKGAAAGGDIGLGSNSFAVDGSLSTTGGALVANDMHLGLRVPNIWFRARLCWGQGDDAVDVSGLTLPGLPGVVAGSNGHVAWGFTNSYGDWLDWVRVRFTDRTYSRYRSEDGEDGIVLHDERIDVAGGRPEFITVRETRWGPLLAFEDKDTGLALAWTAHRAGATNFALSGLERARSTGEALSIANRTGMPAQNFIAGDRAGTIGWTLAGRIPARGGADGSAPSDWAAPYAGWRGWLPEPGYPRVISPPGHRLWTANARTVDGIGLALLGDGGYALGARAKQIRDGLYARDRFAPADLLAVQLDDRSLFLQRWWQLLRETLGDKPPGSLAAMEAATRTWDERASVDAVAYRMARAFRLYTHELVLDGLGAPMRATDPEFRIPSLPQAEGIVWKTVHERPGHLLPPQFADWNALLLAAAQRVADELGKQPGGLQARRWGERNTAAIRHPISGGVPMLSWLLDMPADELAGDSAMPRVQGPAFGASERFVVSPGHEAEGILHMPGGQSGHPLSPFYGAGHEAWVRGEPTPFLPGETRYRLELKPAP
jgi:penicillin amidase